MQQIKRSRLILLHYGIFKIGWDWLILLCTFYVAIMVPYNAAFVTMEGPNERASIVSDVIVEMLFIIGKAMVTTVIRFDCDSTAVRLPPDCSSTALRPFHDFNVTTVGLPTVVSSLVGGLV